MALKSYLFSKELNFSDIATPPIHLGNMDGRYYFSFAESSDAPSGGKAVTADEIDLLQKNGTIFKQIKQEAERRILAVAPLWRQQNALADLYILNQKESLTTDEQDQVAQAEEILTSVQAVRSRSNEIESSVLNGIAVEYLTDYGWNGLDAE